jgi:hypothetical protein
VSNFCFYRGIDLELVGRLREQLSSLWGQVREVSKDRFWLFLPLTDSERSFCEWDGAVGAISGYVRRTDQAHQAQNLTMELAEHRQLFIKEICDEKAWPLADCWTGSFGAVAYSTKDGGLSLCDDLIGYVPLYFSTSPDGVLGGTSLIALARSMAPEVDAVGVLQRITPPYCNYGRRTLFKEFSRLLPGELIRFPGASTKGESAFDNTLFKGSIDGDADSVARLVWSNLQSEIDWAIDGMDRIAIALSGGWDSRLVLKGLERPGSTVDCLTYGNEEHYESQIAKRCAGALPAPHYCFPIEANYFPPRESLEPLILETESANYMEWFNMIRSARESRKDRSALLLGDLCESIDGRYIEEFASRKAKRKSFARGVIGVHDQISPATAANFAEWKKRKSQQIVEDICRNAQRLSSRLAASFNVDLARREISSDLELSFSRVEENMPAFAPVFDELFAWFHRVRFLMANQLTWLDAGFDSLCPAISMGFLRFISRVNPRLRMRRRLMNAMARLPEFDSLSRIPSAQIPWLDARQPGPLKDLAWGIRSGLDQLLIKRVLSSKNPDKRQRVLRSLDYIKEYRRETVIPTVRAWFSGDWITADGYIADASRRASLNSWPLINVDIAAPANVSMILDLCSNKPQVTRPRMTAEGISFDWPVSAVSGGREPSDTSIR